MHELWVANARIIAILPVVQPFYDFWHLFDEECTVHVDGVACKYPGPFFWDPLLDVVENLLLDEILGVRRSNACLGQTALDGDMSGLA